MQNEQSLPGECITLYNAKLTGLQWEPVEFPWNETGVSKIVVSASGENERLAIQVFTYGQASVEDAQTQSNIIAKRITQRIGYHFETPIGSPKIASCSFINEAGEPSTVAVVRVGVRATGSSTQILGTEKQSALRDTLSKPQLPGESLYGTYLAAIACSDPVAKFLVLYQLLMLHHDDKQHKVDQFVLSEEPGTLCTLTFPTEKKGYKSETVYSRLRNQIGHNRRIPLETTRAEMGQHDQALARLVRRLIDQQHT